MKHNTEQVRVAASEALVSLGQCAASDPPLDSSAPPIVTEQPAEGNVKNQTRETLFVVDDQLESGDVQVVPAEKRGIQNHAAHAYFVPRKVLNAVEDLDSEGLVPQANADGHAARSVDKRVLPAFAQGFDELGQISGKAVSWEGDYVLVPCIYDALP